MNDVWQQDIGVHPIRFTDQGDEWCHHLTVALTGDSHMAARGTDGTDAVELGPPLVGPVHSKLLVRPHADGISCVVTGDGDSASADQVEPWRSAADTAVSLLGRQDRIFAWEAILGTAPQTAGLDRTGLLGEAQDFGPVHLAPGGVACAGSFSPSGSVVPGFGTASRYRLRRVHHVRVGSCGADR